MVGDKQPAITKARPPFIASMTLKGDGAPFSPLDVATAHGSPQEYAELAQSMGIDAPVALMLEKDKYPLPMTKDREFYHGDRHAAYWMSGLGDYLKIKKAAADLGIELDGGRYFEMGCASGRVVRHVACQTTADVWCCDLNLRHTEWIRAFLPESIKAFHNHALPHLPLSGDYFDVVSAFSVFTHIDDFEFAWLMELRRILKKGGMAYLTIQSEHTWESYKQTWIKDQFSVLKDQITELEVNDELFAGPLPREKTVMWWPAQDVYNSTVFHTTDYIRREWSRFFEVVDIRKNGHAYQDVVILRRPG